MAQENSKAGRENVVDLSAYYQRSHRESNLKFHLSYSGCSQQKKREKEYSFWPSVLRKEENFLSQKWDMLNTAIYLPADMQDGFYLQSEANGIKELERGQAHYSLVRLLSYLVKKTGS